MDGSNNISTAVFIGSGNVATHLAEGLYKKGIKILQILSPNKMHAVELSQKCNAQAITTFDVINRDADLYIFSIPDGEISEVASQMPVVNGLVVHTSGFTDLNVLDKFEKHGVFYPLQTFSKNRTVDFSTIPFFLEASDEVSLRRLSDLAARLSAHVHLMDSNQRKKLHLAAVFVSNFNNYLYLLSEEFLEEEKIDFSFLHPLIRETANKIMELNPDKAQTGPARRNDKKTIAEHLNMLSDKEELHEFYQLFSKHILRRYYE